MFTLLTKSKIFFKKNLNSIFSKKLALNHQKVQILTTPL